MRTVPGPSSRVVVVGAGLAGLSAALHLAGRGREVTVVERETLSRRTRRTSRRERLSAGHRADGADDARRSSTTLSPPSAKPARPDWIC